MNTLSKDGLIGCLWFPVFAICLSLIIYPFHQQRVNKEKKEHTQSLLSSKFVYFDYDKECHLKKSCCKKLYDESGDIYNYNIDSIEIEHIKDWESFEDSVNLCFLCFYYYDIIDTLKTISSKESHHSQIEHDDD